MYKVFYNDRIVFFIDNHSGDIDKDDNKIHYFKNKKQLKITLKFFLKNENIRNLYVVSEDVELAFSKFCKLYKVIEAAGGLVKNNRQNILAIFRRGKWDLPKGKLEKGELPEVGAIREVEEECGINDLEIQKLIEITYHTYKLKNKYILKRAYWYEMLYRGKQKPTPQIEEEITEVKWFMPEELHVIKNNTYISILEVLNKAWLS